LSQIAQSDRSVINRVSHVRHWDMGFTPMALKSNVSD
jgi:hypothetical protein